MPPPFPSLDNDNNKYNYHFLIENNTIFRNIKKPGNHDVR